MSTTNDPFTNLILDNEEQAIEDAATRGEFIESPNLEDTRQMLQKAAEQHRQLQTTKPITLRVNQLDLIKIKAKAKRHNMPYQTLLNTVVHDFAEGHRTLNI